MYTWVYWTLSEMSHDFLLPTLFYRYTFQYAKH